MRIPAKYAGGEGARELNGAGARSEALPAQLKVSWGLKTGEFQYFWSEAKGLALL